MGKSVAAHRNHFAIEHDLARRHRSRHGYELGNGSGDFAQVARVHLHLVFHLVDLDASAIEFVFDDRFTQCHESPANVGCGVGQHRLDRLKRREDEARQRGIAIDQCGPRHR